MKNEGIKRTEAYTENTAAYYRLSDRVSRICPHPLRN